MAPALSERRPLGGRRGSSGRISATAVASSDAADKIEMCRYFDKVLETRRPARFIGFRVFYPFLLTSASSASCESFLLKR
jgi:hypothetical protein